LVLRHGEEPFIGAHDSLGYALCYFFPRLDTDQIGYDRFGLIICRDCDRRTIVKASDVMTQQVVSVRPEASINSAARLMLASRISGLPVIDEHRDLVGIVTESDFLRRAEAGTERKRARWLELLLGPGRLAADYVQSHGRKVAEVMTRDPVSIMEEAPLDEVVRLMEKHRVKRLPVVRDGKVVGIVSRANLLHGLVSLAPETGERKDDKAIRAGILRELEKQPWAPRALINVVVKDGVVELWGAIFDERQREALIVASENVAGVKRVRDNLVWVEPASGMAVYAPDPATARTKVVGR
jgi:CBS domain-containing protein